MKITKVKDEIKHTVEIYLQKDERGQYLISPNKQRPIFLLGAPGIGKTAIVGQVAAEMNLGYVSYSITHHTRQSAIGLPFISKRKYGEVDFSITEYTLSEIIVSVYDAIEKQNCKEGILFIDEINCVSETLAPAMLDLLQNKKFGPHKIPQGWILVSAGNPIVYNKSAREFDTVTLDRIKKIDVDTDYEVWKGYAYDVMIHNSVMYYLQMKPENILRIEKTINGDSFVTPRGWEDLSIMIKNYLTKGYEIDHDVIQQYIQHPDLSRDFYNFYILFMKYQEKYKINDIFEDNQTEWKNELKSSKFDERIAFIHMLSDFINTAAHHNLWITEQKAMLESVNRSILKMNREEALERIKKIEMMNNQLLSNNILTEFDKALRLWFSEELFEIVHNLMTGNMSLSGISDRLQKRQVEITEDSSKVVNQLTIALKFVENVFGKSQELVLFLMNLISSQAVVQFLSRNDCPLFFELNTLLLIGERNKQLLSEIEGYKDEDDQVENTNKNRS